MRVVIAPDCFGGTLTAPQAAQAIAAGWRRTAPADELDLVPVSDGGPGFVDSVHAAIGGRLLPVTVTGPLGEPVPAHVLLVEDPGREDAAAGEGDDGRAPDADGSGGVSRPAGPTAYVESAQACGLALVPPQRRNPTATTTRGVGELVAAAVTAGATRIVVGLGGSGTTDGGAGLLAALGATATDAAGADVTARLSAGGAGLVGVTAVDLAPARAALAGIDLVVASDVDSPLLGPRGAAHGYGPQKGATPDQVVALEEALTSFAAAVGRGPDGRDPAVALGAGAAGGLGYALLALGARREPGIALVLRAVDLTARCARADLVVTGEGSFDWQSLRGKVVAGVAEAALASARPVVVLAGQVEVGRREYVAIGVTAAHSVAEDCGGVDRSLADPAGTLAALAARVARTWSRAVDPG